LKEVAFNGLVEKYGVLRTYMTRHGAGPMPTEGMLSVPAEPWDHLKQPKVEHNSTGPWQGNFRTGHLDLVALKYAIDVIGKVNYLALTHTDCTPKYLVNEYDGLKLDGIKRTPELMELLTKELFKAKPKALLDFDPTLIEIVLGAPVAIKSFGPTCREKWERW
jgi:adenylosuccinate synthase